jgi:hypothetical protein
LRSGDLRGSGLSGNIHAFHGRSLPGAAHHHGPHHGLQVGDNSRIEPLGHIVFGFCDQLRWVEYSGGGRRSHAGHAERAGQYVALSDGRRSVLDRVGGCLEGSVGRRDSNVEYGAESESLGGLCEGGRVEISGQLDESSVTRPSKRGFKRHRRG